MNPRMLILGAILTFALFVWFGPSMSLRGQEPPRQQGQEKVEKAEAAKEQPETKVITEDQETLWIWLKKGGATMIPLGIVTTIIIAFALERGLYYRRQKLDSRGFFESLQAALNTDGVEGAAKLLESDDRLISRILRDGVRRRDEGKEEVENSIQSSASVELGKLERGLNLLNNLGNLAPLLGFFGTVTGMRTSFLQFVVKAAPTAKDLAAGVEEALITTIAGLMIAMPTFFVHNVFIYFIDSLAIEIERCGSAIFAKMKR